MVPIPGNCLSCRKDSISMERNKEEEFISGVVEGKFKREILNLCLNYFAAECSVQFCFENKDYKLYFELLFYRVLWTAVDI